MPDLDDVLHAAAERRTPGTLPDFDTLVRRRRRRDRRRQVATGLGLAVLLGAGALAAVPLVSADSTTRPTDVLAPPPAGALATQPAAGASSSPPVQGLAGEADGPALSLAGWTLLDVSADRRSATVHAALATNESLVHAQAYDSTAGMYVQVVTRMRTAQEDDAQGFPDAPTSLPITVGLPRQLRDDEQLRPSNGIVPLSAPEGYRVEQRDGLWSVASISQDRRRVTITVTLGGCLTPGYVTQGVGERGPRLDVTVFELVPVLEGYGCSRVGGWMQVTVPLARPLGDGERIEGERSAPVQTLAPAPTS